MTIDPQLTGTGLAVGFLVGLTGMGGGALMTPMLILVFGVPPLAAVSSDLVTSLLMKPVGAVVHLRRRTVEWRLVRWLTVGSVPAALGGVLLIGRLGHGDGLQAHLKLLIGAVLLLSLIATFFGSFLRGPADPTARLRPGRTVLIGVVGGLCVGATSVGAGSVVITLLLLAHPGIKASRLVGTDLVQAIPLVTAATLGHLMFGDVRLPLTLALAIGAIPGVYLGAHVSSRARADTLKPVLVTVVLASGLALLRVSTPVVLGVSAGFLVLHAARRHPVPVAAASALTKGRFSDVEEVKPFLRRAADPGR